MSSGPETKTCFGWPKFHGWTLSECPRLDAHQCPHIKTTYYVVGLLVFGFVIIIILK